MKNLFKRILLIFSILFILGCDVNNESIYDEDNSIIQEIVDYDKSYEENDMSFIEYNEQIIILTDEQKSYLLKSTFLLNDIQTKTFYDSVKGTYELNMDSVTIDKILLVDENGIQSPVNQENYDIFYQKLDEEKQDYQIVITDDYISINIYGERYDYSTMTSIVEMSYKQNRKIISRPSKIDETVYQSNYSYWMSFNSHNYDEKKFTSLLFFDSITGYKYYLVDIEMNKVND